MRMFLNRRRKASCFFVLGCALVAWLYVEIVCPRPHPEREKEEFIRRAKELRPHDSTQSSVTPGPTSSRHDPATEAAPRPGGISSSGDITRTATSSDPPRPEDPVSAMTFRGNSTDQSHNSGTPDMSDSAIVSLVGGDGQKHSCQVLEIFEFKEQQYAMLLKVEDETLVIMRLISRDEGSIFQDIDSDEEFQEVLEHIRSVARSRADD
jgi:hypothetical protein